MGVTVVDVARAAGVSKSTAARVLAGNGSASAAARDRVLAEAERLGYRVNRVAQSLRAGTSGQFGLVITNLVNASFQRITTVMQALAYESGYQMLLCVTGGDARQEARSLAALQDHRVDGLVIVCTDEGVAQVNRLHDQGMPVVGLVRNPAGLKIPVVVGDDRRGSYEATEHLLGLGHRKIAYVGGLPRMTTARARYAGFTAAHRDAGVEIDKTLVHRGPFEPSFGGEAAISLASSGRNFSALLITNHEAVFGVLPQLIRNGMDIPGRLSLVCYEDVPLFGAWHPPITVVDSQPDELARIAFESLMCQVAGDGRGGRRRIAVPSRLVVRGSCVSPLRSTG